MAPAPRSRLVPRGKAGNDAEIMTAQALLADIWAAIIAASLLSIVALFVIGAAVSVLTVLRSRAQARARSPLIEDLARECAPDDLVEIDEALQRGVDGRAVEGGPRRGRTPVLRALGESLSVPASSSWRWAGRSRSSSTAGRASRPTWSVATRSPISPWYEPTPPGHSRRSRSGAPRSCASVSRPSPWVHRPACRAR